MTKQMIIEGGQALSGRVRISGSKNAATKMMIASLLTEEPVTLRNCPDIGDVEITTDICSQIGSSVTRQSDVLRLETAKIKSPRVELSRHNRISILALAPLLVRAGEAELPVLGGDAIGPRPVNFHLEALRQMGAEITESAKGYRAAATQLHGASIALPYPSVGATETVILAGVLAQGRTTISGAAIEPEIVDLIKLLQQMGAIIEFRADRAIIIEGVERLRGADYSIMPDRLEAASFALIGPATGGEVLVEGARQEDLITFLNTLRRVGADYQVEKDGIRFRRSNSSLHGIEVETDTYPGFATDWQQPLVVLLTQADGLSVAHETVYEERFGYVETLNRMGAEIGVFAKCLGELPCRFKGRSYKHSAVINGPTPLHAADIEIPDIRAGMAHVLAALVAEGKSKLTGVDHLLRGYERLPEKLRSIGANFSSQ